MYHAAGAQAAPASSPAAPSAAPPTTSTKEKASKEKGSEGKEKAPPPLFASDSTVSLIIRVSNLEAFMKDRDSTTKRPYAATIRYASSATDSVSVPVELRARGHYRRKKSNCSFPPVHVTFGDKETTKGTLFAKQRPLKLVTPCREKDNTYEQYIVREYMAVVYQARDRVTGTEVAIKLIRAKYQEDEEAIARFAREARLVARLQHPRIVPVHAIRQLDDNSLAIVMEMVPGRTLRELIRRRGPLTYDRATSVLCDIAEALGYAHSQGIVHRDVKPENVFLHDATGRAYLSDFGIARTMDSDTNLTVTGVAIGTPTYMGWREPLQRDLPAEARSPAVTGAALPWHSGVAAHGGRGGDREEPRVAMARRRGIH